MNSYISNLYLKPTEGATSQRLTPTSSVTASFASFQRSTKAVTFDVQVGDAFMTVDGSTPTSTNGHRLYATRAYTLSVEAAKSAQFLADAGNSVIYASEMTN